MLVKEIAEKNCELRHMRGEDLQELTWEELQKLEKSVEGSLRRIVEEKGEKGIKEINALKTKEEQLVEENQRLKQQGDGFISWPKAFARTRQIIRFFSDQYKQYDQLS
ncbi:hypothetical protein OIU76_025171 [Salix suchowensis]|nr:hypothetical protein OIU76_025171 [Salix suchowensis]